MTIDIVSYDRINKVRKELLDKIEKSAFKGFIVDKEVFREEFDDANLGSRWDKFYIDDETSYEVKDSKFKIWGGNTASFIKRINAEGVKSVISFPNTEQDIKGDVYFSFVGDNTAIMVRFFFYTSAITVSINYARDEWFVDGYSSQIPIDQNVRDYYLEVIYENNIVKVKVNDVVIKDRSVVIVPVKTFVTDIISIQDTLIACDYIYLNQLYTPYLYEALVHVDNLFESRPRVALVTEMATAIPGYTILADASSSNGYLGISLPPADRSKNKTVTVKKIDSSSNVVRITAYDSGIDGTDTIELTNQWQSVTLVCDGNRWYIISSYGL